MTETDRKIDRANDIITEFLCAAPIHYSAVLENNKRKSTGGKLYNPNPATVLLPKTCEGVRNPLHLVTAIVQNASEVVYTTLYNS